MEEVKIELKKEIEKERQQLVEMGDFIFDNPEVGFCEFKAANIITEYLTENGFNVKKGAGGLDTSFLATYEHMIGGPEIGLLCEYDALENFGHGCAHHLQGPSIAGAAVALKRVLKGKPFKISVIGTPAEESLVGGKTLMIHTGIFDSLDVALMMHGSVNTQTDIKSLALTELKLKLYGKAAHTAIAPEKGRSALDGLIGVFNGIAYLKTRLREDAKINGIITRGGDAVNIVPAETEARIEVRANDREYLNRIIEQLEDVIKGAAVSSGTRYEMERLVDLDNKVPVLLLNDLLLKNASLTDAERLAPHREKTGSTDFASVMYRVPGSCIRVAFAPENTASHSEDWLKIGKSEAAHKAILTGAEILSMTSWDLINQPELLGEIKDEFARRKAQELKEIQ